MHVGRDGIHKDVSFSPGGRITAVFPPVEQGVRWRARSEVCSPPPPEEMCSGSEAGSYLRLIDSCIAQLKAQRPSRTCSDSKEEEEEEENAEEEEAEAEEEGLRVVMQVYIKI